MKVKANTWANFAVQASASRETDPSPAAQRWLSSLRRPGTWCVAPHLESMMTALLALTPRVSACPVGLRVHASDRLISSTPALIDLRPGPVLVVVHGKDEQGRTGYAASLRSERRGVPAPAPLFADAGDGFFLAIAFALERWFAGKSDMNVHRLTGRAAFLRERLCGELARDLPRCEALALAVPLVDLGPGRQPHGQGAVGAAKAGDMHRLLEDMVDRVIRKEIQEPPPLRMQLRLRGHSGDASLRRQPQLPVPGPVVP
jgi:hypothetical protein